MIRAFIRAARGRRRIFVSGAHSEREPGPNRRRRKMSQGNWFRACFALGRNDIRKRHDRPAKPNSFRSGPDEPGHFGIFGGRFVAETLMPLILDLEKAYADAKADPAFQAEMNGYLKDYVGRPSPLYFAERLTEASRRRENLSQARGAQSHRLAQGQQRARPDHGRAPHGQEAHHRRDRRRPARRRHRDPVRALRARMHRLHGRRRRRAAEAERLPHEHARRQGGAGPVRRQDPQGRDERGAARLGDQCRRHVLLHRHGRGPASLSDDGARFPVDHRPRDARADAGGRRPPAGFAHRLHRRRLQRHGPVPPLPRRSVGRDLRRRGRGPRPRPACTRPRSPAAARACCTATAPIC